MPFHHHSFIEVHIMKAIPLEGILCNVCIIVHLLENTHCDH